MEWPPRFFHPRRTLRPTREGWWCLLAAMGLGFAAINTGNNLLYLLESMLLGLIVVSGILSEQSLRGIRLVPVLPAAIHAGTPVRLGARVVNAKRRLSSYSLALLAAAGAVRLAYVPRLLAGDERLVTWEVTLPRRGRQRLPGVRLSTRFPFGLFTKSGRPTADDEVIVYPAVRPLDAETLRYLGGGGSAPTRRAGRGHDLHNLREYRAGDDPRLIHWRTSARRGALVVRELQAETTEDVRLRLHGTGAVDPARLEDALSEAASLACALLRRGAGVEIVGPGLLVRLGHGRGHERRVLTALALYEPGTAAPAAGAATNEAPGIGRGWGGDLREIVVGLD
jgi:uncharacterized protein (DUF58 family)